MLIFVFYKISMSILQIFIRFRCHFLHFLSRLTSYSTTFKVAVSHFVFTHVESYVCITNTNLCNIFASDW